MQPSILEMQTSADAPSITVDDDGIVSHINEMFVDAYGWSPEELVGRPLTLIIPEGLRDAHNMGFSRVAVGGASSLLNQPLTLKIVAGDGRILNARHLIVSETVDGRATFAAYIYPES